MLGAWWGRDQADQRFDRMRGSLVGKSILSKTAGTRRDVLALIVGAGWVVRSLEKNCVLVEDRET